MRRDIKMNIHAHTHIQTHVHTFKTHVDDDDDVYDDKKLMRNEAFV